MMHHSRSSAYATGTIVAAALALLLPATAWAQKGAVQPGEMRRRMVQGQRQALEQLAKHPEAVDREQLPLLELEDGWPRMTAGDLRLQAQTRVPVKGDDAAWVMMLHGEGNRIQGHLQRITLEAAEGQGNWMVTVNWGGAGHLTIVGLGGDKSGYQMVMLSCADAGKQRTVHLNVNEFQGRQSLRLTATSLTSLQEEHPEEVQQYVVPLLEAINGYDLLKPPAVDIYRVFDHIEASPRAIAQVKQLLAQLGSPLPDQRSAGSKALRAMGRDGVLAVLRMDLSRIGPEERSRIEEFLAANTARRNFDTQALRRDPRFLIECLADDDAAVRSAAKSALAEAKQTPIDFDVHAPAAERKDRIVKLRKALSSTPQAGKAETESPGE